LRFVLPLALILFVPVLYAQEANLPPELPGAVPAVDSAAPSVAACSESQQDPQQNQQPQSPPTDSPSNSAQPGTKSIHPCAPAADPKAPPPQPKRILGVMPNFRAVSAGALPPPPTPKQSLKIATLNSFDYSAYLFTGFTTLEAMAGNTHPELGKGVAGFGRYYWRGFLDRTDGNYWVIFVLPTFLHQDERYYAIGKGGFFKRAAYSASRVLITPNYEGKNTFNASEIFGRGIAQGISISYYPSRSRTAGSISRKYAFAIGRDALTNVFREFWPDIAVHVLHRHP
jgi:hypothetical protein